MAVLGSDDRQTVTDYDSFPISAVTAVDTSYPQALFFERGAIGSGIMVGSNHVLSVAHTAYDPNNDVEAKAIRTTLSSNEDQLADRDLPSAGAGSANVTDKTFLEGYVSEHNFPDDLQESFPDDIALFTISNTPLDASEAIGVTAFLDPAEAQGLSIQTAGYPADRSSGRELITAPEAALAPGRVSKVRTDDNREPTNTFEFSRDIDAIGGQSGSGIWTTLDGDSQPRVIGVLTGGAAASENRATNNRIATQQDIRNFGTLLSDDAYAELTAQMKADSQEAGMSPAVQAGLLPQNAIIGSTQPFGPLPAGRNTGDDDITGSYRAERIQGLSGDDRLFGSGGSDELEGGSGTDYALFSGNFSDYEIAQTDTDAPTYAFLNRAEGGETDAVSGVEFAAFGFTDRAPEVIDQGVPDDLSDLFVIPLEETVMDGGLPDGPTVSYNQDIETPNGDQFGTISADVPAYMFDGDISYSLRIGAAQNILYNFAYIVDSSGSMAGTRLAQTKDAYAALTNALDTQGVADNSNFAVVDFDNSARLYPDLTADEAIARVNSLPGGGGTEFGAPLTLAEQWFESTATAGRTNIAFFLSDGQGSGADPALQRVNEGTPAVATVDVRAFGIGSGADLSSLSQIDSNTAEPLATASDLIDAFSRSGLSRDTIDHIDVVLNGSVKDTVQPGALTDETLGLTFDGTLEGLNVGRDADNDLAFKVVFNDGTPTATLAASVTTGQTEFQRATNSGDATEVRFGITQSAYTGTAGNEVILGNALSNSIAAAEGVNTIRGVEGADQFVIGSGTYVVDGGKGVDTATFSQTMTEAGGVSKNGNVVSVGRENTFVDVEFLDFTDTRIATTDLEVAPVATLDPIVTTISEGDAGTTTANFDINLSEAPSQPVEVAFSTREGSAEAGADFVQTEESVVVGSGETTASVAIDLLQDEEIEGTGTFFVVFSIGEGATFANGETEAVGTVQIRDDDAAISLVGIPNDRSVLEGDPGTPNSKILSLRRSGDTSETDVIGFEVSSAGSNPATAADFSNGFPSGTVTFDTGEKTKTVKLPIEPDTMMEKDETFGLSFTSMSGSASVASEQRIFTIKDDDEAPAANEIRGTDGRDNLRGTDGPDQMISLGGSYDRMAGSGGADDFIFGAEATNGVRERDVISNFDVAEDSIVLRAGASIAESREQSDTVVLSLDDGNDVAYIRGDGVSLDTVNIVDENLLV